jgi:hypothetical protein
MASSGDAVCVAKPSVSEATVRNSIKPTGRVLLAANLSANQPQKK